MCFNLSQYQNVDTAILNHTIVQVAILTAWVVTTVSQGINIKLPRNIELVVKQAIDSIKRIDFIYNI
jgi:hypothetical protein